jgi:hypothetical protein
MDVILLLSLLSLPWLWALPMLIFKMPCRVGNIADTRNELRYRWLLIPTVYTKEPTFIGLRIKKQQPLMKNSRAVASRADFSVIDYDRLLTLLTIDINRSRYRSRSQLTID